MVFVVVQVIEDGLLVPRIMGKITGLNPAIILLSLSVWGSLMGVVGMIIALPLTTLMLSYYQRFIIDRERINTPQPIAPTPAGKAANHEQDTAPTPPADKPK